MARSEIDDIFASKKPTAKAITQSVASTSTSADPTSPKRKKKYKKRKGRTEEAQDCSVNEERPQKKRVVETIFDPSTPVPSVPSSKVSQIGNGSRITNARASKKLRKDSDRFKDSRGTGPRKWKNSRPM